MRTFLILIVVLVSWTVWSGEMTGIQRVSAAERPSVEVVFILDSTGSMGGLIEGAKQKIWSIANQIVRGEPTPYLKIGLVGYRDRGDEYVTKGFPLDDDLDVVFDNLMSFQAGGGGDTPEHVNRALYDGVYEMKWSEGPSTLKLIFLVGDCPPHMDYNDGYDYRRICAEAVKRDIIINTIQCGNYPDTERFWRDIARRAEGSYAAIAQTGGMRTIETPMDADLALLNEKLEATIVAFGSDDIRTESEAKLEKIKKMEPSAAAERAAYKSAGREISAYDLVDAIKTHSVRLEDLSEEELPPEMRKMSVRERTEYLEKKEEERGKILAQIKKLSRDREVYIQAQLEENKTQDSFDEVVQKFIEKQARDKGIIY
jgi:Mg-chelatase subunit ChlD